MGGVSDGESEEFAPPLDFSHHFGDVTKALTKSETKAMYEFFKIPGIGQLAGGLPNAAYFPYDTLEASVALPQRFRLSGTDNSTTTKLSKLSFRSTSSGTSSKPSSVPASRILVPKESPETNMDLRIDLTTALQYGTGQGYGPLYSWLLQFTRQNLHPTVPYKDGPDIVMSMGNTDGFSKAIETLSNEWVEDKHPVEERCGILVETFCYLNPVQLTSPRGLNVVPVSMDDEGMLVIGEGGLQDVLGNWEFQKGKRPHLLYTVTVGQNPTGGTLSVERKKAIYAVCQKYDIIIIEDDPYWFLQYPSSHRSRKSQQLSSDVSASDVNVKGKSSGYAFLDSLAPSYLSVDTDGRVVRLDTFSKVVAPGCRLGWITAQPAIIERITRVTEVATQQPSGFVQAVIAELLMGPSLEPSDENGRGGAKDGTGWSVGGWVRWLEGLRGVYEQRMQTMCMILDDGRFLASCGDHKPHLGEWSIVEKTEIYSFKWPAGGMFVWIRVNYASHPLATQFPLTELADALWVWLVMPPSLVLISPGAGFSPTEEIRAEKGWSYFRICFAAVSEEDVESCSRRFVEGMHSFWMKESLNDLQKFKVAGKYPVPTNLREVLGPLGC